MPLFERENILSWDQSAIMRKLPRQLLEPYPDLPLVAEAENGEDVPYTKPSAFSPMAKTV